MAKAERSLIYHPSGRAGAYADKGYAANIFKNCSHGCRYCYVPKFTFTDPAVFSNPANVTVAPEMLSRLESDMKRVGKLEEPIFLCFTCDPYCCDAPVSMTRDAISIIMEHGNCVNILTKGGMTAVNDFDLLRKDKRNKIGATLTFATEALSKQWEPLAAVPVERIQMLVKAKSQGIQTWASIEPVIMPEESLRIMELAIDCVDEFKVGKWNHSEEAEKIDWPKFIADAEALMQKHGKKYVLKEDLLKYKGV